MQARIAPIPLPALPSVMTSASTNVRIIEKRFFRCGSFPSLGRSTSETTFMTFQTCARTEPFPRAALSWAGSTPPDESVRRFLRDARKTLVFYGLERPLKNVRAGAKGNSVMRLSSIVPSFVVAFAAIFATACGPIELEEKSSGENGKLTFEYESSQCEWGCNLDRPAL